MNELPDLDQRPADETEQASSASLSAPDSAPAQELLERLQALLEKADAGASELARQEEKRLLAALGKNGKDILNKIAIFDYAAALKELRHH